MADDVVSMGLLLNAIETDNSSAIALLANTANTSFAEKAVVAMCKRGNVEAAASFRAKAPRCSLLEALNAACRSGHLCAAQWVAASDPLLVPSSNIVQMTVWDGHLAFSQWLLRTYACVREVDFEGLVTLACSRGHLHLVQWLYSADYIPDVLTTCRVGIGEAAAHGHVDIVKWLAEFRPDAVVALTWDDDWAFRRACTRRHLRVAEVLVSMFPERYFIGDCTSATCVPFEIRWELKHANDRADATPEVCTVCLEATSDVLTDCRHQFCTQCIRKLVVTTAPCPLCRHLLSRETCFSKFKA